MKIELSSKNFELTPSLTGYVEEKMGLLDKHVQKMELEGELMLKVRIGRITGHHHKGDVYEATADLDVPGAHLRAEAVNEDVRTCIDEARDVLAKEIEKYKDTHA